MVWARSILNLPGVEGKVSSSNGGILVFPFLIEKWILIIGGVCDLRKRKKWKGTDAEERNKREINSPAPADSSNGKPCYI